MGRGRDQGHLRLGWRVLHGYAILALRAHVNAGPRSATCAGTAPPEVPTREEGRARLLGWSGHLRRRRLVAGAVRRGGRDPDRGCGWWIAARAASRSGPSRRVPARPTWWMAATGSCASSCSPASRPTPGTRASIPSPRRSPGRSSPSCWSRSRSASAPTRSPTAAPARATTRCVSMSRCARSTPSWRSWRPCAWAWACRASRRSTTPSSGASRSPSPGSRRIPSTTTSGAVPSRRASWRTRGRRRRRTSMNGPSTRAQRRTSRRRSSSASMAGCRSRSMARSSPPWSWWSVSTRSVGATASVASTTSRTGSWASRAARSTRLLPPPSCISRMRRWKG